ncbi:MAG: hypothetical protein K9G46_12965 [Flavobacteriales bacterium]|nr:hypothetical protein [Flavobacteriales bacterium]
MKIPFPFLTSLLIGCAIMYSVSSCEKLEGEENEANISEFGDDDSHYHGRICMDCHARSGSGEGWFTVAGSMERNSGNSLIELYRYKNGPMVMSIEVDDESNFFTTEPIDFSDGLVVAVRSPSGELEWMDDNEDDHPDVGNNGEIYSGSCNTCHGVTTDMVEPD